MKAKMRTIRWRINKKSIDVDYGRIRDGMSSVSFSHYKNITSSTQKRILRIIGKFGSRWVYTIEKEGYNEIDLWYKEPTEAREKWLLGRDKKKIIKNSAKCLICNDIIASQSRHDFVTCTCGNISLDGGKDYLKRSVKNLEKYKDLSE